MHDWLRRLADVLAGGEAEWGLLPRSMIPRGPAAVALGPAPLRCPHGELGPCILCDATGRRGSPRATRPS